MSHMGTPDDPDPAPGRSPRTTRIAGPRISGRPVNATSSQPLLTPLGATFGRSRAKQRGRAHHADRHGDRVPVADAGSAPASIIAGPTATSGLPVRHQRDRAGDARGAVSPFPFPVPNASARPFAVAAGPDGNVWFTERNAGRIGRITPSGTITEFPLPSAASAPTTIAAGPDGTHRFAALTGNAVRWITVTGAIEEYPLTDPGAQPWVIALGADGNLWLTESHATR
jgi:streptogramin lyase